MRRTLFSVGSLEFHSYTTLLCLSLVVGGALVIYRNHRRKAPYPISPLFGIWITLGSLFGARVFYVVQFGEPPYAVLQLSGAGLVFYGGLAGGIASASLYAAIVGVPVLRFLDLLAPSLALGEAITRVGCLLNGCCWGKPCALPWAVSFPPNTFPFFQQVHDGIIYSSAEHSVPIHAFQLYMAAMLIGVSIVILILERRRNESGGAVRTYLLLYGIGRFFLEPFRADSARPWIGMSVSQIISLAVMLVVSGWIFVRIIGKRENPMYMDKHGASITVLNKRAPERVVGDRT